MVRGVVYARSYRVDVVCTGGSEANRGRREVAIFATAWFKEFSVREGANPTTLWSKVAFCVPKIKKPHRLLCEA
tara:strand:- start:749 stop:970 length:222 start_codon:yes stop_codon:yes gene_type:complete